MQKMLAVLCCTLFTAASTGHYLRQHYLGRTKHYKPPAIAVQRMNDTLIITNLRPRHLRPPAALHLAGAMLNQSWSTAPLAPVPTHTALWPGLAAPAHTLPATGSAPPVTAIQHPPDTGIRRQAAIPDIGDGDSYAQLTLDAPCKTIAQCNWQGGRAIRAGVPGKAVRSFRTALQLATEAHDPYMALIGYHNLAMTYWWMKQYKQAAAWAQKGLVMGPPTALIIGRDDSMADE